MNKVDQDEIELVRDLFFINPGADSNISSYQFDLDTYRSVFIDAIERIIGLNQTESIRDFFLGFGIVYSEEEIKLKSEYFLESMAQLYFDGKRTLNINYLLSSSNLVFLNHIDFLKNLKVAVVKHQRKILKSILVDFDSLELTNTEFEKATIIHQRKNLKDQLKKADDIQIDHKTIWSILFNKSSLLKFAAAILLLVAITIIVDRPSHIQNENIAKSFAPKDTNEIIANLNPPQYSFDSIYPSAPSLESDANYLGYNLQYLYIYNEGGESFTDTLPSFEVIQSYRYEPNIDFTIEGNRIYINSGDDSKLICAYKFSISEILETDNGYSHSYSMHQPSLKGTYFLFKNKYYQYFDATANQPSIFKEVKDLEKLKLIKYYTE